MSESEYSASDPPESEDEEEEDTKPRKGRKPTKLRIIDGEVMCKRCGQKFPTKNTAYKHTRLCANNVTLRQTQKSLNKCMWCGLEFTNRGNLATHAFHIHGDASYRTIASVKCEEYTCQVCNKSYKTSTQLRYHIRGNHFNLTAKVPYAESKKVNQIWYEKVQNSNKIMEIKKTGRNTLIMRTLQENTEFRVNDGHSKFVDLRHIYPTLKDLRVMCNDCNKSFLKRDYKKHFEERHLNKKKHFCNNCNRSFKRSYLYLQHSCSKVRKVKGVHHNPGANPGIRISSVESFSVPLGL